MPVVTPEDTPEREKDRNEAVSSGNVPYAIDAEWIDYDDAGVATTLISCVGGTAASRRRT